MTTGHDDKPAQEERLRAVLAEALQARAWPGGALAVVRGAGGDTILPHGYHTFGGSRAVRVTDYVDVASLTKVVATTTAVMLAYERGLLGLDDPVTRFLGGFAERVPDQVEARARIRIEHLLTHTAGFPAHVAFHRAEDVPPERRAMAVMATALEAPPGAQCVYSDIGMMVLGFVLNEAFRQPWPRVVRRDVFGPLMMRHTRFCLPPALRCRALPTECTGPLGAPWQGVVHDENARWLGGVAGHAGLFSTAGDLCRFARMLLSKGQGPGGRVLQADTVERFVQPARVVAGSSRCLGWDSPTAPSSGGDYLHASSYGHTGFTGTSMWIDPVSDLAVILLTNAVHPRRECRAEHDYFAWRRRVHSAVYGAMGMV